MNQQLGPQKTAGFTLLEALLTFALVAVLAGISIPVYQSFQQRNDLDIATNTCVQSLRRAQTLAQAVANDQSWGVYLASGNLTIYQGVNYTSRDPNFDEFFDLPASVSVDSPKEFVFSKVSGLPTAAGNVTLISSNNQTKTITVNSKGTVSY